MTDLRFSLTFLRTSPGFAGGRLLFGMTPADPTTFVVAGVALTAIAAVACGIPARRAAKVDPIDALRR